MSEKRSERIRRSAEWAAFGDALGFITELADADRVQHRAGAGFIQDTIDWKRKIGGQYGVTVEFRAGTYSDDTQLRLATGRAIRADGTFDVAAFAKVELTAWANYALGAGISSKEAAANLARTSATWYSNFFETKRSSYINAGGNGAAMRIQPHVWAAPDLKNEQAILRDVIRNAICTHGHSRGILGACFHALTLTFALREGRPANLEEMRHITENLRLIPKLVQEDGDLTVFWLGPWEKAANASFKDQIFETIQEIENDLTALSNHTSDGLFINSYELAIDTVGARAESTRGSGTKTAIIAAFAALISDLNDPRNALIHVANTLGTDTDSIATMAGAIIGSCSQAECDSAIQDQDYIKSEAYRLGDVAAKRCQHSFRYPDLRSWKPTRAAVDAVGIFEESLWLNGLGALTPFVEQAGKTSSEALVWCELDFGQTILARVREMPNRLSLNQSGNVISKPTRNRSSSPPARLNDLFRNQSTTQNFSNRDSQVRRGQTLSELLRNIIAEGFPPELIGKAILQQADENNEDFVEKGIALTATILTAYEARFKGRKTDKLK